MFLGVKFKNTTFIGSNLKHTTFDDVTFENITVVNCDFYGAEFKNIDDFNIKYDSKTVGLSLACPETGSFIGYKKADNKIVELLITEDALRSSATTKKCRCSKAKVLSITDNNGKEYEKVCSDNFSSFIYQTGKLVEVYEFDTNRWNECSSGIHFFIDKQDAINY